MTLHEPPRFLLQPSPVGDVLIVAAATGIVELHPIEVPLSIALERVALRTGMIPTPVTGSAPHPEGSPSAIAERAADAVEEYFDGTDHGGGAGARHPLDLPWDWTGVHGFTRAALEAVCTIPYGETASYGEVAVLAGSPGAARAVGTACARTPFSILVPVHRVVRADGSIGEYGGRPEVKRALLDLEVSRTRP